MTRFYVKRFLFLLFYQLHVDNTLHKRLESGGMRQRKIFSILSAHYLFGGRHKPPQNGY